MSLRPTVLVIDTNDNDRSEVSVALVHFGHDVIPSSTRSAAAGIAYATRPDLVLLDISASAPPPAGDIDAFAVLDQLQHDERTAELPVVLLTRGEQRDEITTGLRLGALDHVDKPVRPATLLARVNAGLEVHRLRRGLRQATDSDGAGTRDRLTGLVGPTALRDQLSHLAADARRHTRPLSIVLLDVDRFGVVNERFGRAAGDHLLRDVADRLAADVRGADTVGRWQTDQFLALLPSTPEEGAVFFAERFRQTVAEVPVRLVDGTTVPMSASFGCAGGDDAALMIVSCEAAVSTAKRRGRNTVVAASEALT